MTNFVHAANLLFLASFLVRDIFWLRVLSIIGGVALMPFYIANDLHASIGWNSVFMAINMYQIRVLWLERRPVVMSEREERIYHLVFRALRPREFLKLLGESNTVTPKHGEAVIEQGKPLEKLLLIEDGQAIVEVNGKRIARLGPGRFVGEMSYLTGDPASARVVSDGELCCVEWSREALDAFLAKHPDIKGSLQMVINTDLIGKLRSS